MTFRKYMHLEKFGTDAVEGIELGRVHVFPKIDGTNASSWCGLLNNDTIAYAVFAGSRTRELSHEQDNAGFYAWLMGDSEAAQNVRLFNLAYPNLRLYGEWLVPHSFKGYRPDAWRQFYVFDVFNDETGQYMSYDTYQPLLQEEGVLYIPPLAIVNNGEYTRFLNYLETNKFLCPDDGEPGEGIVLKNYDFYNKFDEQCWAKIVRQEFKELHAREMGAPEVNETIMNEERILNRALTQHLVDKTFDKIKNERGGWSSKYIPELLERIFYDIVKEELWDSLKEIKFGSVNFKTLKAMAIMRIKQMKKDVF